MLIKRLAAILWPINVAAFVLSMVILTYSVYKELNQ